MLCLLQDICPWSKPCLLDVELQCCQDMSIAKAIVLQRVIADLIGGVWYNTCLSKCL